MSQLDPDKATEFARLIKERNYYSLLSVSKTCTPEELKKSYRKIALRLHPDRNLGMEEDATVLFAKVQAAYDILSDPQERAYYDQYGSRRGPGGSSASYEEDEYDDGPGANSTPADQVREWIKQTERYQGTVSGGESKFYSAAGQLFEKLGQEERDAYSRFDPSWEPLPCQFGTSKTDYQDLVEFYNRWTSFSTRKSFSWFDKYDVRYAEDRRTRRAMDTANNRVRDSEKRKFNEAVRSFARFIKKNDPRFRKHVAKMKGEPFSADKGKKSAKELSEQDRKRNAKERTEYEQQDWERVSETEYSEYFDSEEEESEDQDSQESFEDEQSSDEYQYKEDSFECVACNKTFKSSKQLADHERSKKHIKATEQLRKKMEKEEKNLGLNKNTKKQGFSEPDIGKHTFDQNLETEQDVDTDSVDEFDTLENKPGARQKRNGFSSLMESDDEEPSADEKLQTKSSGFDALLENDGESEYESPKPSGFGALVDDSGDEEPAQEQPDTDFRGDDDGAEPQQETKKPNVDEIVAELQKSALSGKSSKKGHAEPGKETDFGEDIGMQAPKIGKAKQRRLKKQGNGGSKKGIGLECNVCGQLFASKNKLFEHVRNTGHAAAMKR